MPAAFAKTVQVTTTAGWFTPPPQNSGMIRIQNLDPTNAVWLALGRDNTSAERGDDSVRLNPGDQYITSWMPRHNMVAITANCYVLMESL